MQEVKGVYPPCTDIDGAGLADVSQRRCIHDEQGNVDATKAAEQPVPRGSNTTRKKQTSEERQRSPMMKKQKLESDGSPAYMPMQTSRLVGHGVLKPNYRPSGNDERRSEAPARGQPNGARPTQSHVEQNAANIDPSLFTQYSAPEQHRTYSESSHNYPYPSAEHSQPYPQAQPAYQMPSLEEIANEVLDMSGHDAPPSSLPDGFDQIRAFNAIGGGSLLDGMPNSHPEVDGSVDSGVSLPVQGLADKTKPNGGQDSVESVAKDHSQSNDLPTGDSPPNGEAQTSPSNGRGINSTNQETAQPDPAPATSPTATRSSANDLPLYQPPAPLAKSPERTRAQPVMVNGTNHSKSPSPATTTTSGKRKRDSISASPSAKSGKKVRVEGTIPEGSAVVEEDERSMELAKMLLQEERGLRRRTSRE